VGTRLLDWIELTPTGTAPASTTAEPVERLAHFLPPA
jgi:hypothetical protein